MVTLSPHPRIQIDGVSPRVEILGVFGSGKTTLALKLGEGFGRTVLEEHLLNPLWGKKNLVERLGHLPYDLHFLLQHAQLATLSSMGSDSSHVFCDWSFLTDRLWASMRLDSDFEAYDAAWLAIRKRIERPVGYVYVQQTVETIVERIGIRGRAPEVAFVEYVGVAVARLQQLVESLHGENVLQVDDGCEVDEMFKIISSWKNDLIGMSHD
jgi:deoxyadenosine/deoxycytidine kinase